MPGRSTSMTMPVGLARALAKVKDLALSEHERVEAMTLAWEVIFGEPVDPSMTMDELLDQIMLGVMVYMPDAEPEPPDEASLSSLFAVVDAVFTEHDAFYRPNVTMGRIYREWKKVRRALGGDDYVSPEQHEPEVTIVIKVNGEVHGVYSDARDAGYILTRLDKGARAQTIVLR